MCHRAGILIAKVMTVRIKQVIYKETAQCMQEQSVCHLTEITVLFLLIFLEAMSVLLFILCSILYIHCIMLRNAYLY